jgi:hypothetical protein
MPVAMTYSSLLEDVVAYIERGATLASDPTVNEQLPNLINLAERRLARELKIQGTVTPVTTTFVNGTAVYPKPDRWRETVSINCSTTAGGNVRTEIFPRSYEYCRSYWPDDTLTGTPRFYADYDYSNWLIVPTPGAALSVEILYYDQPPYLDETNQTNWWTEYAPNALLYATLLETAPFLKNAEATQVWEGFYTRAIASLNGEDLRQIVDRGITRRED